jgi:putative sterol carrier protein
MAQFLSPEWINAYREEWNGNSALTADLGGFTARIKYYVDGNEAEAVEVAVADGVVTSAGPAGAEHEFVLWASPENWRKLATGEIGPKSAMLTTRLKFKGSMVTATKYMGPFEESLRMMSKVPTDWPA